MQTYSFLRGALAVAALAAIVSAPAQAQIVYSGPVNISIPDNIDGIYMNLVTGVTGISGGAVAGWDINPYTASSSPNGFHLWGATTTTWLNTAGVIGNAAGYVLAANTSIGPGPNFFRPGGGTNLGGSVTLNAPNLFGVQFSEGGNTHYAWVEITFGGNAGTRAITGWAYEATPGTAIAAGVVPEPGTYALMLAGLAGIAGFAARRRKAD